MQACDTPLDWAKREKQHEIVRLLNNAPYIRMEVCIYVYVRIRAYMYTYVYVRMPMMYSQVCSPSKYIRMEVYTCVCTWHTPMV